MSTPTAPPPPSADLLAAWAAAEAEAEAELAAADARAAEEAARRAAGGAPAGPQEKTVPRRGRGRKLALAAVVVCAVGAAVAGKALVTAAPPPDDEAQAEASAGPEGPKPVPSDSARAARIDLLIRAGSYKDALQACQDAAPNVFGDEQQTAYRVGLCLEGLGKPGAADAAYQRAEKGANVGGWARAVLGRARCALAEDSLPVARALADRVLLRSGHPECRGGRMYEEALHLRAQVAVLEAGAPPILDPLAPDALAWPSLRGAPDAYLDWLPTDAAAAGPNPGARGDAVELNSDTDPTNPALTLRLTRRPVLEVLRAIATAAGLDVRAGDGTPERLGEVIGPVETERLPLGDVLSALTERAGVAWAVRGGALHLTRAPRAPQPEAAAAALRRALAVAPEHPATGAVRVALANLDARAGRSRAAVLGYKQVMERPGNPPEATHAAFNLGLMELRTGNLNGARARFLEVIDRGPDTRFADLSWCWIGRTYLDGDDPGAARRAYRTAFDGKTKEAASAAALAMIACDLLTGDDESARALLEDARFSTREPHAALVSFYEALFRHRTAPTESRYEILLRALRDADEGRGLGPAGVYLAGRVYTELKLPQQAAALFEREIETARGPLALRMIYDTAERYDRLDQRERARSRYLSLTAADPTGLGGWAELKLAALDARDGNGAEAVRRCRALLSHPGVPREETLAVMGRGYEIQKRYAAAAECFAGRLPE